MNEMRKLMEAIEQINEGKYTGMGDHYRPKYKAREATNTIIELMDDGILNPRSVADAALRYMSEQEVADMAYAEGILIDDEE